MPVAQKVHPIWQPTSEDTHSVARVPPLVTQLSASLTPRPMSVTQATTVETALHWRACSQGDTHDSIPLHSLRRSRCRHAERRIRAAPDVS